MKSIKSKLIEFKSKVISPINFLLGAFLILSFQKTNAQNALENYLNEGLKNNIVVQEKNITLDKAIYGLKDAQRLFLPAVNFNASYTSGEGGRTIPLPIGDLLNPVYSTLNQLTHSSSFPQVSNQNIGFFPVNFYDAKVRTTAQIYNSDLKNYLDIEHQVVHLREFEILAYKRELIKDLKTAYFNYLMAITGAQIYQNAILLVNRNIEVNKSLLSNGKGLPASVLRAESEYERIKNQLLDAQNNIMNAQHYFNFLLNKKQDDPIDTVYDKKAALLEIEKYINQANINAREELKMASLDQGINTSIRRLDQQFWLPKVSAFLDLGSQASDFAFNSQSRYVLVGAQIDIPIFNWGRNNYKINQANDDLRIAGLNAQLITNQLQLSADMAKNYLATAYSSYQASLKELTSAQSYFKLIESGVKEGINSQIEFIDARNQLTNSQISVNINLFKVLQAMASVERETATYHIQK